MKKIKEQSIILWFVITLVMATGEPEGSFIVAVVWWSFVLINFAGVAYFATRYERNKK